jgi:thioredoxin:protein disulfide reductase
MPYRLMLRLRMTLLCLATLGFTGLAGASPWWLRGSTSAEQDFLPPDVAFHLTSQLEGDVLQLRWVIADGYFLYRNKIQVRAASPDLVVGPPALPVGTRFDDKNFGLQEVYFQQATVSVPVTRSDFGAHPLQVLVTYQGCAQSGFCYPPISKVLFPESGARAGTAGVFARGPDGQPVGDGSSVWEAVAILGGAAAFLYAGLIQRRRRRLPVPSA